MKKEKFKDTTMGRWQSAKRKMLKWIFNSLLFVVLNFHVCLFRCLFIYMTIFILLQVKWKNKTIEQMIWGKWGKFFLNRKRNHNIHQFIKYALMWIWKGKEKLCHIFMGMEIKINSIQCIKCSIFVDFYDLLSYKWFSSHSLTLWCM